MENDWYIAKSVNITYCDVNDRVITNLLFRHDTKANEGYEPNNL